MLRRNGAGPAPYLLLLLIAVAAMALLAQPPGARTRSESAATTGQLIISDDAGTAPLFRATGLMSGSTVTNCIQVSYQGAYPGATLRMYATVSGAVLPRLLSLTVEVGQGGRFGNCAGFTAAATAYRGTLAAFAAGHGDASVPLTVAALDGDGTLTLRLRVRLGDGVTSMGITAGATFGWVTEQGPPPALPAASPVPSGSPSPSASPAPDASVRPASDPPTRPAPVQPTGGRQPRHTGGHGLPLRALAHHVAALAHRVFTHMLVPAGEAGSISLSMLAVVALFLLVQNRLDRRDPKLAQAPVHRPEDLEFIDRSEIGP